MVPSATYRPSLAALFVLPSPSPVVVCQRNAQPLLSYIGETMGPLAATADGSFLFAGSVSGRIYAWEVLAVLPLSGPAASPPLR